MNAFRILLIVFIITIISFTGVVVNNHGWDLFSIFFNDIVAMTWSGQFNFDFSCYLMLSGLWLAWRHHFSPSGLILGMLGCLGGMMFLAPYLFIASYKANGNMQILFLGKFRGGSRT